MDIPGFVCVHCLPFISPNYGLSSNVCETFTGILCGCHEGLALLCSALLDDAVSTVLLEILRAWLNILASAPRCRFSISGSMPS